MLLAFFLVCDFQFVERTCRRVLPKPFIPPDVVSEERSVVASESFKPGSSEEPTGLKLE
jgi:hypothetical protein